MRRKKKLIINLLKLLVVIAIAVGLFFIFNPIKKINTADTSKNQKDDISVNTTNKTITRINLPERIKDSVSNSSNSNNSTNTNTTGTETEEKKNEKIYTPITEFSERYFIPILSANTVTLLIGDDSEKIIPENSPVEVGLEYTVTNIEETLRSVYYFSIDNYSFPILLLLGESGKLYYVDMEDAYQTGNFAIKGYIQDIPEVDNVYQTKVQDGQNTYRSAVIKCTNEEGYEFTVDMIGR